MKTATDNTPDKPKITLPAPVQSEYEPEHWSYFLGYDCGHVLHASGGFPETQQMSGNCPSCANPRLPEFADASAWCRAQRMQTLNTDQELSAKDLAEKLGINRMEVYAMEAGQKDPAVLVAYWKGQGK